jgi:hypothetical protein
VAFGFSFRTRIFSRRAAVYDTASTRSGVRWWCAPGRACCGGGVAVTNPRRTLTRPTVDWACNIMTTRWKMRAAWQVSGYINYTYGIAGNVRTPAVASNGTCSLVNSPLEGTRKP